MKRAKKYTVGFVGLGIMGKPMVINLIKKHVKIYFYARKRRIINQIIDMGGHYVSSIKELTKYSDIFITNLLQTYGKSSNICLPLFNQWNDTPSIDNLVIISHPDDAERICKLHVKKAPIFKSLLYTSIISTTDNDDWKNQRGEMNMAFLPNTSLKSVFPESVKRARNCSDLLINRSNN